VVVAGVPSAGVTVVERLRDGCRLVAASAQQVRIDELVIPAYADSLELEQTRSAAANVITDPDEREREVAYWLTLDAINFGSGWFPTLRKLDGRTGYRTIAAGVDRRFAARGPWNADGLAGMTAGELADWLGQDPDHELVELFAGSLRDLGARLLQSSGGSFTAVVDGCDGSAIRLVETLAAWQCFADVSTYDGLELRFLKRAQIVAADLARAGAASFGDLAELTMFADNLVPHVLRLDGVLSLHPGLVERIEREELIEHGSPAEVEIRACAVHAVELIVAAAPFPVTAAEVDQILWNRGQGPLYKGRPRHRSRSTAY
jgi:hypothetical protein